jgi:acyl dehydratase
MLMFEDLTPGLRFRSAERVVDAAEIVAFAERYDPQPAHLDDTAARETMFRGLAASGWHTAAITMALTVASVPVAGGIIGAGMDELRWPLPVRPGDLLHTESEVLDGRVSRSKPSQGLVRMRTTTVNQDGAAVQVLVAVMVVPVRGAGA